MEYVYIVAQNCPYCAPLASIPSNENKISFLPSPQVAISATTTLVVETLVEISMTATTLATLEEEETTLVETKATWVALEAKEIKVVASTTNNSSSSSSSSKVTLAIRWEEVLEVALEIKVTHLAVTLEGSALVPVAETSAHNLPMGRIPTMGAQVLEVRCHQG